MALRSLRTLRSLGRHSSTFASLNGVPTPAASLKCSIWDVTFQRGDGVFEAVRVVKDRDGLPAPRTVGLHLDRLERSAAALELPLPPREHLESWMRDAARKGGEGGYVRLMVTRGGGSQGYGHHLADLDAPPNTFCVWQPISIDDAKTVALEPLCAPWHPAGFGGSDWATIKWLSYGANVHSARLARKAGADDALLLARGWGVAVDGPLRDRAVLDGPNFAVAWMENKVLKVPCWRKLGMLESITARLLLDAAAAENVRVDEGVHRPSDLERADEVYVASTTNDLTPVKHVGTTSFKADPSSPARRKLVRAMADCAAALG